MKNKNDKYIELGGCSKPHGIKGGFAFHLYNSDSSVLKKGSKVLLTPNSGSKLGEDGEEFEISTISFGNKVIVYLKGIADRNRVEAIIPFTIFFKNEDLPKLEEDEFYLKDLIGLDVINELTGEKVGKIESHYDNTAHIVLVIRGEFELEIPLIDNFVKEVNVEEGMIKIIVPEVIGPDKP